MRLPICAGFGNGRPLQFVAQQRTPGLQLRRVRRCEHLPLGIQHRQLASGPLPAPGSKAAVLRSSAKTRQVSSADSKGRDCAASSTTARSTVASVSCRAVRAEMRAATAVTSSAAMTTATDRPSGICTR